MAITNAQLAQQISELLSYWRTRDVQFRDWLSGTADGGPYGDGTYPLTDYLAQTFYVKSPARLQQDVDGLVNSASSYASTAQSAASAAQAAQAAAETARDLAASYRVDALAYRDAANEARLGAENAAANALGAATNAAASAAAALQSEANAALSEANAATSEANAAASAAAAAASAAEAATFDPDDFLARASENTDWNVTGRVARLLSTSTNGPVGGTVYMGISIPHATSVDYAMQLAGRGNNLFFRTKEGGSWGNWYVVFNTGRLPTWDEIAGKPATFTPSAHTHPWDEIANKPVTFTPSAHTHSAADITSGTLADSRLSANVARRNQANTFQGSQRIESGSRHIDVFPSGTPGNWVPLSIRDDLNTDQWWLVANTLTGDLSFNRQSGTGAFKVNGVSVNDAALFTTGTLADARIPSNIARLTGATFTGRVTAPTFTIGDGSYTTSVRDYSVTTSAPQQLLNSSGAPFTTSRSYRVTGSVLGTGTHTGAQAVFFNEGGTWKILKLYERGVTSNHVEFFVDPVNGPSVRLWNHASTYTVRVFTEELSSGGSNGAAPWGYQGFREIANVPYFGATQISLAGHTHSAVDITSGTLSDSRLSSNVPLKNNANAFTTAQSISAAQAEILGLKRTNSDTNVVIRFEGQGITRYLGFANGVLKVGATADVNSAGTAVSLEGHTHNYLPLSGGTITGNTAVGGTLTINAGGGALSLKTGVHDHVFMEFYADTQNPNARSAYFGFGGVEYGSFRLDLVNQMGGDIYVAGNQIRFEAGSIVVEGRGGVLHYGDTFTNARVFVRQGGSPVGSAEGDITIIW